MGRRTFLIVAVFTVATSVLILFSCGVNLDAPTALGPELDVQIEFVNHHQGITAEYHGNRVGGFGETPSNLQTLPGTVNMSRPNSVPVVPDQTVNFERASDLRPGKWNITVDVFESGQPLFSTTCEQVEIPCCSGIYGLTVIEGRDNCTSSRGSVSPANVPYRDVAVLVPSVPGTVEKGTVVPIAVTAENNSKFGEEFMLTLSDNTPIGGTPGEIIPDMHRISGLPVNESVSRTFQWNTAGASLGNHELVASVPALLYEEVTANNTRRVSVTIVESHDVEALSVTPNPPAADIGDPVQVAVSVRNNGNLDEGSVHVALTAQPPGGGTGIDLGTQTVSVSAGVTAPIIFNWDTACVGPPGTYVLTANVSVPNDNTANNTASAQTSLSIDHELSILITVVEPPGASVANSGAVTFYADLVNNNSVAETGIDVSLTDSPQGGALPGSIQDDLRLPVDLGCGETKTLFFQWRAPSVTTGTHDLTVTITTPITGDDPADNSDSVAATVN